MSVYVYVNVYICPTLNSLFTYFYFRLLINWVGPEKIYQMFKIASMVDIEAVDKISFKTQLEEFWL